MAQNNAINAPLPLSATQGGLGLASPTVHGILVAEGAAAANPIVLTNGQLLIGSTGADPVAATLTAGSGISFTNAAGSITITATGSGEPWTTVTGTSQALAANNGYYANNAALVTLTLPTVAAVGDLIMVGYQGAGGWKVAQNAGQSITDGNVVTTSGTGGSLASSASGDNVTLRCLTANTTFMVWGQQGNLTYV